MKTLFKLVFWGVLGGIAVIWAIVSAGENRVAERALSETAPAISKDAQLQWYIEWKRVRKYARIAVQTAQTSALETLNRDARHLYLDIWHWPDGEQKATCYDAAEQLEKALRAITSDDTSGVPVLQASEMAGDRCLASIQRL